MIDATAFGQAARPPSAPPAHRSRRRRGQRRFGGDVDDTALSQIETAEKKLYDLASPARPRAASPFRAALTEATLAAEAAYHRVGQLTGVASGLFQLDQPLGGLHRSDLIILAGPSMGKTALATNIAFNAARAYREDIVDGKPWAVDGAVVASPWKCRPSSSPRA